MHVQPPECFLAPLDWACGFWPQISIEEGSIIYNLLMRLQYAAEVDWSVEKSLKTPLRLQYAHAAMSSFTHFIHTNTSSIFSQSLVYGSGWSRENVAGSITSTGGTDFHGGESAEQEASMTESCWRNPSSHPTESMFFFLGTNKVV